MTVPETADSQPAALPPLRHSPLARAALLAYVFLIVYASWFPFTGWRSTGLSPFTFLENTAMPRYWTGFDVGINIVGYVPLGALIVYSLFPRVTGWLAILIASLCGVFISGSMETVQSYLPSRVSSNLDFYTNSAGCCAGAIIGALSARKLLDQSRLLRLRQRWFAQHASQGLILVALWPLAQIYPQGYLFGLGQLLPILSDWLSTLVGSDIDLAAYLRPDTILTVEQYWLSETIITACGMTGAVLTLLCLLRRGAPRATMMLLLIGGALVVRSMASALLFSPQNAFVWITPGAQGGFLIGLIMLGGLAFAPHVAQRRVATATLLLSLVMVNITPINPYFMSTLQGWVQGKFLNFNGAAQFLALLWPFVTLWFLCLPSHRLNRQEDVQRQRRGDPP
ncbi:VanZ family protein [Janthinobacterium sp. Mn2066]|uniref:VanZ family protein n=1 Tax=Janthinobacterium sp. Mn2066 TaxID=3395264 RepID=UPI003BBE99C6